MKSHLLSGISPMALLTLRDHFLLWIPKPCNSGHWTINPLAISKWYFPGLFLSLLSLLHQSFIISLYLQSLAWNNYIFPPFWTSQCDDRGWYTMVIIISKNHYPISCSWKAGQLVLDRWHLLLSGTGGYSSSFLVINQPCDYRQFEGSWQEKVVTKEKLC